MRATVMYSAGDVRIENVPDAHVIEPTDALVTVTRACICGSDLWPYKAMEQSEGGPKVEIRPGDVVLCPPKERHWHGATSTTGMSHIAIQEALDGKVVEWQEKVSDEQYEG